MGLRATGGQAKTAKVSPLAGEVIGTSLKLDKS